MNRLLLLSLFMFITFFFLLLLSLFSISCKTVSYDIKLSPPPSQHYINNVENRQDLYKEYTKSVMKISEWQNWYNIQIKSNHFNYNEYFYTNNK